MRTYGTCAYGVRTPVIKYGDDLVDIVATSVINMTKEKNITLKDKDIVCVTEAVVAISQGNYASTEDIACDVRNKIGGGTVGLIFPILSRNRFMGILQGIAQGVDELIIQLSYPFDEVGNPLVSIDTLYDLGITKFDKAYTSEEFYNLVKTVEHPFTGVDYIKEYLKIGGKKTRIILSNDPLEILKYTDKVINADIHSRKRTKRILLSNGAKRVLSLDEILNDESAEHGYHPLYGVLGSNRSKEGNIKLFPRGGEAFVTELQLELKKRTGINLECMVYGDGAFKDPVGGIWELADPVVSPAHTDGLLGTPNEIKLKYISDNVFTNLRGEKLTAEMKKFIANKDKDLKNQNVSLGTTPRRYTDLIGSLCDLVSGSGDKGTPVVLITGYFDNYASD
ncbi:MAG: coenzyme F420-0:L-glutamate ligase [Clostridia bacterium]|nr:coenzyme F420-0:L-glutamate ligase [Clostridia bacterium]